MVQEPLLPPVHGQCIVKLTIPGVSPAAASSCVGLGAHLTCGVEESFRLNCSDNIENHPQGIASQLGTWDSETRGLTDEGKHFDA